MTRDPEEGFMNRRTHGDQFGPRDRIAAFAEATEVYAKGLEDPDLANVYWGKSLGLWQALAILTADDRATPCRPLRGPSAQRGPRRADLVRPSAATRPVAPEAATTSPGR
ncbi:MAG: hypothetical protein ACRDH5_10480 [bacterium]